MIDWKVVPIEKWPADVELEGANSPFSTASGRGYRSRGVNWSQAVDDLERELRHLGARDVLLQMDVRRQDIRLDGWIRANASPGHPGVILTFFSEKLDTTLSYPSGKFRDWQSNVRALALGLHDLRRVERYGIASRGEQYRGWGQLPPAGGTTATMTARIAAEILTDAAGWDANDPDGDDVETLLEDARAVTAYYRDAARRTHPDHHGGDTQRFQLVGTAKRVLDRHHGVSR